MEERGELGCHGWSSALAEMSGGGEMELPSPTDKGADAVLPGGDGGCPYHLRRAASPCLVLSQGGPTSWDGGCVRDTTPASGQTPAAPTRKGTCAAARAGGHPRTCVVCAHACIGCVGTHPSGRGTGPRSRPTISAPEWGSPVRGQDIPIIVSCRRPVITVSPPPALVPGGRSGQWASSP